jgi:hypothetical protein
MTIRQPPTFRRRRRSKPSCDARATPTMALRMPIRVWVHSVHSTTRRQYYRSPTQVRIGVPDPIHKLSTTSKEFISSKLRMIRCTGSNWRPSTRHGPAVPAIEDESARVPRTADCNFRAGADRRGVSRRMLPFASGERPFVFAREISAVFGRAPILGAAANVCQGARHTPQPRVWRGQGSGQPLQDDRKAPLPSEWSVGEPSPGMVRNRSPCASTSHTS